MKTERATDAFLSSKYFIWNPVGVSEQEMAIGGLLLPTFA